MAMAVERLIDRYTARNVVLIGYSGGGVLAVLIARMLDEPVSVVTLAAPLDVAAWTGLHGYSPLVGSIDPAEADARQRSIRAVHLYGEQDENVPALINARFFRNAGRGTACLIIGGYDHDCCWVADWPERLPWILKMLEDDANSGDLPDMLCPLTP